MTEAEWLAADHPRAMLNHLQSPTVMMPTGKALISFPVGTNNPNWPGDRKMCLWVGAMYRMTRYEYKREEAVGWRRGEVPLGNRLFGVTHGWCNDSLNNVGDPSMRMRAHLLRDVVGNPFRAVTLCGMERKPFGRGDWAHVAENQGFFIERECAWCKALRTPDAVRLARDAYKANSRTGVIHWLTLYALADALEEAGCRREILDHLRDRRPHVRGCWAIDLVLGNL